MESTLDIAELLDVFRSNLKARRQELGITQAQLAAEIGVAQPFVARLENGVRTPSLEHLAKLAEALKTTPDALLSRDVFSGVA